MTLTEPGDIDRACTDMANARRFAQLAADRLLYVNEWGWLAWDGRRWARDTTGEADRVAREVPAAIYREAGELAEDTDGRKKLGRWALQSESWARRRAMLADGPSEPELRAKVTDEKGNPVFDADPMLLNCLNGTLDLRTGELRPHHQSDRLTRLAPVTYRPGATHPTWTRYLATATAGEAELAAFCNAPRAIALTGSTDEQIVFLVLGPEATGKTTLAEALLAVLGAEGSGYGRKIAFETLLKSKHGGGAARPDIAGLAGVRLAVACESAGDRQLDAVAVKDLAAGYGDSALFVP